MNGDVSQPQSAQRLAFEILVRQHQRGLLVHGQSLMAAAGRSGDRAAVEGLVQDSLVVAYENLHRFDHSREFPAWGRGILRLRHMKDARSRERSVDTDVKGEREAIQQRWNDDQYDLGEQQPIMFRLEHCLQQLSDPARSAIESFYLKQEVVCAIASSSPSSISAVKRHLQRGRDALLTCLEGQSAPSHLDDIGPIGEGIDHV